MKITSCADNTRNKNLTTMTVKDIRGRLDKILATGSDVMCGCSVQEGKLVFRKKQMKNFEDNADVIVNVTGELKSTADDWLRRVHRRDLRSGRVAAKIRGGT